MAETVRGLQKDVEEATKKASQKIDEGIRKGETKIGDMLVESGERVKQHAGSMSSAVKRELQRAKEGDNKARVNVAFGLIACAAIAISLVRLIKLML